MSILKLRNVSKQFRQTEALKDVSLTVEEGYVLGLIGCNGAGKTTLIKTILGLISTDSGSVTIFGKELSGSQKAIKERIGFVHEESVLYENLTARETGRICRAAYPKWDSEAFLRYLKDFEIPERKRIKTFSKGSRMRLSLAIALSHEAELLIMDEPSSGLDPLVRKELYDLLRREMMREHRTIIISTHITSDLEQIADHIAVLDRGEIVKQLSTEELREEYALCRCDPDSVTDDIRGMFIGYEEHPYSFSGLTGVPGRLKGLLGPKAVFERPTIEELFIYSQGGTAYENTAD